MENEILKLQTEVNPEGEWTIDVLNELSPGSHTLVVTDEFGNSDSSLIFVQSTTEPEQIEIMVPGETLIYEARAIVEVIPPVLIWVMFFSFLIFLIFATIDFFLARRVHGIGSKISQSLQSNSVRKISRIIMISSVSLIVVLFITLAYLLMSNRFRDKIIQGIHSNDVSNTRIIERTFMRSGTVRDPISMKPTPDISLSAQNVTITTSETGQFNFQEVNSVDGIKIEHPSLNKTFILLSESAGREDIYFQVDLYKQIEKVINAEISEDFSALYTMLNSESKENLSLNEFSSMYSKTYSHSNLSDQVVILQSIEYISEIRMSDDRSYSDVIRIVTKNGKRIGIYQFIYDGLNWLMIK